MRRFLSLKKPVLTLASTNFRFLWSILNSFILALKCVLGGPNRLTRARVMLLNVNAVWSQSCQICKFSLKPSSCLRLSPEMCSKTKNTRVHEKILSKNEKHEKNVSGKVFQICSKWPRLKMHHNFPPKWPKTACIASIPFTSYGGGISWQHMSDKHICWINSIWW